MQIAMTEHEQLMLAGLLRCSHRYLEFGSGGSTVLASRLVRDSVIAVDSSRDWLDNVAAACPAERSARLDLHHVDIGPLGNWGVPTDEATRPRWPDYHLGVWANPAAERADLVLVDGLFRVACFIQAALRCAPGTTLLIHDYPERAHYHPVEEIARPIMALDTLVAFQRRPGFDPRRATAILEQYWTDLG